jgi:hypothetical protein
MGWRSIKGIADWRLFAAALFLAGILSQAPRRVGHDVGWFLYSASRLLDGARLYQDVVDPNPPMIFFLNLAPAWISRVASLPPPAVLKAWVIALMLASLILCSRSLAVAAPSVSARVRASFLITLVVLLVTYVGSDFGQREHFLLLFVAPYLLLASARASGLEAPPGLCAAAGMFAGVGFAIKPFFLLPWVFVEASLFLRCRGASLWRRENWAIAGIQSMHLAYIFIAAREYYEHVFPLTRRVYDVANVPLASLLSHQATLLCALAVVVGLAVPSTPELRELRRVIVIAAAGALACALVQRKGFGYHFYPAAALAISSLVAAAFDLGRWVPGMEKRVWRVFLPAAAAATVALSQAGRPRPDDLVDSLVRLAEQHARGERVVLFNLGEYPAFPALNYAPAQWGSRFSSVWFLSGFYRPQHVRPGGGRFPYRAPAVMDPAERYAFEALVSDLLQKPPRLLMIDCRTRWIAGLNSFSLIEYLSQDARVAELLSNYRHLTTIHCIEVFNLTGPLSPPERLAMDGP